MDFWGVVEVLLNTLLFTLAGTVWGQIIVPSDKREESFVDEDWGYLFALFLLLNVILFFSFFAFTLSINRLDYIRPGKKRSFRALRVSAGRLELRWACLWKIKSDRKHKRQARALNIVMIGGAALLTLVINGTLSRPLAK